MKYLELQKFPTHKASSFHFSSNFYSLNSLFSFPSLKYIDYYGNSDISDVGEAKWYPPMRFEANFTKWVEGGK